MNEGVFVVCLKEQLNSFHVEKCFKGDDWEVARREIGFLQRVTHGGLSMYTGTFSCVFLFSFAFCRMWYRE